MTTRVIAFVLGTLVPLLVGAPPGGLPEGADPRAGRLHAGGRSRRGERRRETTSQAHFVERAALRDVHFEAGSRQAVRGVPDG